MTRCPTCHQPLPQPTEAHVVDGVMVEPSRGFAGGSIAWRAAGRPDLGYATSPHQAAQLAKVGR